MGKPMVRAACFIVSTDRSLFLALIVDEPIRIKEATVAQETPTRILHIRGLTRPFTLLQLKELFRRYGTIIDEAFWLENIKSQCLVTVIDLQRIPPVSPNDCLV